MGSPRQPVSSRAPIPSGVTEGLAHEGLETVWGGMTSVAAE